MFQVKKAIYSIIALFVILIGWRHFQPQGEGNAYDLAAFAELPVQVGGRIKPLDSVARNALLVLSSRQKVETIDGRILSPIEWFADLTMRPELADTHPVFKIEFPDDLGIAGLAKAGERYYAYNDLLPTSPKFSDSTRKLNRNQRNVRRTNSNSTTSVVASHATTVLSIHSTQQVMRNVSII